jgi:hypothetical protein
LVSLVVLTVVVVRVRGLPVHVRRVRVVVVAGIVLGRVVRVRLHVHRRGRRNESVHFHARRRVHVVVRLHVLLVMMLMLMMRGVVMVRSLDVVFLFVLGFFLGWGHAVVLVGLSLVVLLFVRR